MTDLDTIKAMLEKAQIPYTQEEKKGKQGQENKSGLRLYVERGYSGFYSVFTFSTEKALENLEAYE